MKVLWITNILFAHHYEMMGVKGKAAGGSWLYAAYEESLKDKELELHIVTSSYSVSHIKKSESDGNSFYIIPGGGGKGDKH